MAVFQVILNDIGGDEKNYALIRKKIGEIFKLTPEAVDKLTKNLPKIVAKGLQKKTAERYVKVFASIGASAELRAAMDDAELDQQEPTVTEETDPEKTHRQLVLTSLGEDTNLHFKIRENLAQILEVSKPQVLRLTSEIPVVLKRHLSESKAENIATELRREGAYIEIQPDNPPPQQGVRLEITDYTREYIEQLIACGVSRKIVQQHMVVLKALEEFTGTPDITSISPEELRDFQSCSVKRLPEARDINLLKTILQSYYHFLEKNGYTKSSPIPITVQEKRTAEFQQGYLELNSEESLHLGNAGDEFQSSKPAALKLLFPFEQGFRKDSGTSISIPHMFRNFSVGLQSLILTGISTAIILLIIYGLYSFGFFGTSTGIILDPKQFFNITQDLVRDLHIVKNWYITLDNRTAELEQVNNMYDFSQLVSNSTAGEPVRYLQNEYLFQLYDKPERLFIFKNRGDNRKRVILNMKLKEAYIIKDGISKEIFNWK
jgi:hypothetical protein